MAIPNYWNKRLYKLATFLDLTDKKLRLYKTNALFPSGTFDEAWSSGSISLREKKTFWRKTIHKNETTIFRGQLEKYVAEYYNGVGEGVLNTIFMNNSKVVETFVIKEF